MLSAGNPGPIGQALADFRVIVGAATPDELPELLGELEAIRADLWLRVQREGPGPVELLDVAAAAALLRVPRRKLFDLARGATWAHRVGRRLLVDRRALLADVVRGRLAGHVTIQAARNATQAHEPTRDGLLRGSEAVSRAVSCSPVARNRGERG